MPRAKNSVKSRARRKKVLKKAKGFRGRSKNCFRIAFQRWEKAMQYMYRDRRNRKRDFRALWIQRINAAVRQYGIIYSDFMKCLKDLHIGIDRKMLSEMSIREPKAFKCLVEEAKKNLKKKAA